VAHLPNWTIFPPKTDISFETVVICTKQKMQQNSKKEKKKEYDPATIDGQFVSHRNENGYFCGRHPS